MFHQRISFLEFILIIENRFQIYCNRICIRKLRNILFGISKVKYLIVLIYCSKTSYIKCNCQFILANLKKKFLWSFEFWKFLKSSPKNLSLGRKVFHIIEVKTQKRSSKFLGTYHIFVASFSLHKIKRVFSVL